MNGKDSPTDKDRIARLEQENAEMKKTHMAEESRLNQEILRLQKQIARPEPKPSFSTKTREERLKRQDGV